MSFLQFKRTVAAVFLIATLAWLTGCGSGGIPPWQPAHAAGAMSGSNFVSDSTNAPDKVILQAGDPISITFADVPPPGILPWQGRIGEDGKITLHLNVTVNALGKTANQVSQEIRDAYVPKYYKYLTATVKPEERFYFVGGEVRTPGSRPYSSTMTVTRAIDTAGGLNDYAKRSRIILTRANGQKFKIDYKKAIEDPAYDPVVYPNDRVEVGRRLW